MRYEDEATRPLLDWINCSCFHDGKKITKNENNFQFIHQLFRFGLSGKSAK